MVLLWFLVDFLGYKIVLVEVGSCIELVCIKLKILGAVKELESSLVLKILVWAETELM